MKIIHILNHFLPAHIAGTEVYAYNLGKMLMGGGFELMFLIPNYGVQINETYDYEGMGVVKYAEPSTVDRALQMGKRNPDGLIHFINILKAEKPDIVHFHEIAGSNGITFAHVEAAKRMGLKTVMTFHLGNYTAISENRNTPTDIFNDKAASFHFYRDKGFHPFLIRLIYPIATFFNWLKIDTTSWGKMGTALAVPQIIRKKRDDFFRLLENCDAAVVIAHWYQEALEKIVGKRFYFIEQGIANIPDEKTAKAKTTTALRLIFVGRISHFKGVKMLIEVVKSFPENEICLDIYGDSGEDKNYINECKALAETSTHIQFCGSLASENVIPTMTQYDVLVLPSWVHEMSPLVIREAFAAGIPVLASRAFGNAEQITDGKNGWLFSFKSKEDLHRKIEFLLSHPEAIEKAKKHIPPVRTFAEVGKDYERLYHQILG